MKTNTLGTKEWGVRNFNFSSGCSNNCFPYCYAAAMANRYGRISREKWANMINRPKPSFSTKIKVDGTIMTPTSHDITPLNVDLAKKYYLELLKAGNELLIVTKPIPKVIKELALHVQNYNDKVIWRLSITNLNQELRKKWEVGASAWWHRIAILKWLFENGYQTSVSIEPFLENPLPIVQKVLPFVTEKIWVGPMNKIHVLPDYWKTIEHIYTPIRLLNYKIELDALQDDRIVYKDTFLNNLPLTTSQKELQDFYEQI